MSAKTLLWFVVVASPAFGQTPDRTHRLTVTPAAAPTPALKYELLPDIRDQSPGNAALNYYRATNFSMQSHRSQADFNEKMARWIDTPIKDLRSELGWLENYPPLRELDIGARKQHCDWDMLGRLRTDGFSLLVPEIGGVREMCNLLVLRIRMEMSEGHFDKAVRSLQTGFGVARHLGQAPVMIFALVGQAIAGVMAREVERLMEQPGAPNLYWALATLPTSLFDLREAMQAERLIMTTMIPDLAKLESGALTTEAAREALLKLYYNQGIFGGGLPKALQGPQGLGALFPTMMVARNYTSAKQYLLDTGWAPEKVEAMPAPQVVLLYAGLRSRIASDETLKWCSIPYWQAAPLIQQTMKEIEQLNAEAESLPFVGVGSAIAALVRSTALADRRIALLRCVEALRMHAAAHGQWPAKLSDIAGVPIPRDPVFGNEFIYSVEDGKAILSGLPVDDRPGTAERFEIIIRK